MTVLVAVVSSLGAVTLSAFLTDFLRDRRVRNRTKSLVVACLDSVYTQMPEIEAYYRSLSRSVWVSETLPGIINISKNLSPIDLSLFDKVRENLLMLSVELANAMVSFELYIRRINRETKGWIEILSPDYTAERPFHRDMLPEYLNRNSKVFQKEVELIETLTALAVNLKGQMFRGQKKITVDWEPVIKKSQETLDAAAEVMSPSPTNT